jgi:hypothetical protein
MSTSWARSSVRRGSPPFPAVADTADGQTASRDSLSGHPQEGLTRHGLAGVTEERQLEAGELRMENAQPLARGDFICQTSRVVGINQDRHRLIATYAHTADPESATSEYGNAGREDQETRAEMNRPLHEASDRRALRALQQQSLNVCDVREDNTPVASHNTGITLTRRGAILAGRAEGLVLVLTRLLVGLASLLPTKDPVGEPWRYPLAVVLPRVAGEVTLVIVLITVGWLVVHLH